MQKRVTPFSLSGVSVRHSLRHDVARHASDQRNEAGTNDRREKPPRPQNREARQHYRDRRAGRSAEARQRHRSMPCIAAAGNPPRHSDDVVRRGQFSPRRRHPREQRTSLRFRRIGRRSCLHPRLSLIARTSLQFLSQYRQGAASRADAHGDEGTDGREYPERGDGPRSLGQVRRPCCGDDRRHARECEAERRACMFSTDQYGKVWW